MVYEDGTTCSDPLIDPVVGRAVSGADDRVEAKLVDLDPEQQMVSQIWGLQILLEGSSAAPVFRGDYLASPFAAIWVRYPSGHPAEFFGAYWQSTLSCRQWTGLEGSRS